MLNYYFKDSILSFLKKSTEELIGEITLSNQFDSTQLQNKSWEQQIPILKTALDGCDGTIFFEFSIPRMGKRVDSLVIINDVILVIECMENQSAEIRYLSSPNPHSNTKIDNNTK